MFDPVSRHIPKIRIKTNQYGTLVNQRIVVAINDWPTNSLYPIGHYIRFPCFHVSIFRSLGQIGDREVETQVLLLEHSIPANVFSKEVMDCLPPADWHTPPSNQAFPPISPPHLSLGFKLPDISFVADGAGVHWKCGVVRVTRAWRVRLRGTRR